MSRRARSTLQLFTPARTFWRLGKAWVTQQTTTASPFQSHRGQFQALEPTSEMLTPLLEHKLASSLEPNMVSVHLNFGKNIKRAVSNIGNANDSIVSVHSSQRYSAASYARSVCDDSARCCRLWREYRSSSGCRIQAEDVYWLRWCCGGWYSTLKLYWQGRLWHAVRIMEVVPEPLQVRRLRSCCRAAVKLEYPDRPIWLESYDVVLVQLLLRQLPLKPISSHHVFIVL